MWHSLLSLFNTHPWIDDNHVVDSVIFVVVIEIVVIVIDVYVVLLCLYLLLLMQMIFICSQKCLSEAPEVFRLISVVSRVWTVIFMANPTTVEVEVRLCCVVVKLGF